MSDIKPIDLSQDELIRRMRLAQAGDIVPPLFRGGFSALKALPCPVWQSHRDDLFRFTRDFSKVTVVGPYLSGPLGCGKSHLAWCVVENLIVKGFTVSAWNAATLFDELLNSFNDPYYEPSAGAICGLAQSADLFMLDDFGTEPQDVTGAPRHWVLQKLYTIINKRVESELPMLFTSNIAFADIETQLSSARGKQIADRLAGCTYELAFASDATSLRRE